MLKKLLLITLIVILLPLVGFGCKGMSKQEQAATQPIILEYWTVFDDVDALQPLIEKYKADRPYLTINLRQLRLDELYPRLLEALSEDRGPDIVSVRNKWLPFYQPKLAPMPIAVKDTTVRVERGKFSTNTYVTLTNITLPSVIQVNREYVQAVGSDVIIGGSIYGLPLSLDTMALYYNKDLLDRAGVPEPPKTWEEFQAAVKKATKYEKKEGKILQSGTALGTANNIPGFEDFLYILFKQSGVDFVARGGGAVFNSVPQNLGGQLTPAMSVMNFYTDFANSARDTYTWNEDMDNALDKFVNGSLTFFFGYSYHYPIIKARAPQLNFEVLPMLQLNPEQPVNVADYWVQAVPAKSKHQNEAWAFINYLAHSKASKDYLEQANRPSALRAYIAGQLDKAELSPFVAQVLVADSWYKGKNYDGMVKALADMVHEWLLPAPNPDNEEQFRQDILNRAAAKVNQTL